MAVVVLLTATLGLLDSAPPNVAAVTSVVNMGRQIADYNYGSKATIGTSNPYVGNPSSEFSGEMIESGNLSGPSVATGWGKGLICGTTPVVYWLDYAGGGFGTYNCGYYYPSGDNVYTNEYDGNTGYWCHDFNGTCVHSEYYTNLGNLQQASTVWAFGQATEAADVWMGGHPGSNAVYLSNIQFKPGPTTPPTSWTYVKVAGSGYHSCVAPCPFLYSYGFAATVLYTYNWTP